LPQPVAPASGLAAVVHSVQPQSRTLVHCVECRQVQGTDRRHAGVGGHCEDDDHLVPGCLRVHNTKELSVMETADSVLPEVQRVFMRAASELHDMQSVTDADMIADKHPPIQQNRAAEKESQHSSFR
jgi:hypothetical protein